MNPKKDKKNKDLLRSLRKINPKHHDISGVGSGYTFEGFSDQQTLTLEEFVDFITNQPDLLSQILARVAKVLEAKGSTDPVFKSQLTEAQVEIFNIKNSLERLEEKDDDNSSRDEQRDGDDNREIGTLSI